MPNVTPNRYARWRSTTLGNITEKLELDLVLELAGPLEGKRVLDVGTGDGTYAIAAAERGARVIGLDRSPEMLDAGRVRAKAAAIELDLREGTAEVLPFADGEFDLVLAVTVLCFVADPQKVVAEMARVLAPGGRLVFADLGRWSTWAAWRRVKGVFGSSTWRGARFWSVASLSKLLADAGLTVEEVRGSVYYPPLGMAARLMAPLDRALGRVVPSLAAFVAVSARKT